MIESPLMQELKKEWTEEGVRKGRRKGRREGVRDGEIKALMTFLIRRFGAQAEAIETEIKATDDARLKELLEHAATCRSLAAFRRKLQA